MLEECFKALADKTRLRIFALLRHEELCVCELVEILQMTQPAISQHLRKLKSAKLVKERQEGQWIFYSLDGSLYPFLQENLKVLPDMGDQIEELKQKGLKGVPPTKRGKRTLSENDAKENEYTEVTNGYPIISTCLVLVTATPLFHVHLS